MLAASLSDDESLIDDLQVQSVVLSVAGTLCGDVLGLWLSAFALVPGTAVVVVLEQQQLVTLVPQTDLVIVEDDDDDQLESLLSAQQPRCQVGIEPV